MRARGRVISPGYRDRVPVKGPIDNPIQAASAAAAFLGAGYRSILTAVVIAHFAADDRGAVTQRFQLSEGDMTRHILHSAIRSRDQAIR
jgi:hypothetical protein